MVAGASTAPAPCPPGITWRWERRPDGTVQPFTIVKGRRKYAAWAPLPGSQTAFLSCPYNEVLYTGTRGGGKTDCLLMDFAQHVGQGWGPEWKGILFRRTYPELDDVWTKAEKWFNMFWPGINMNKGNHVITWPTGEVLKFRHFLKKEDYWSYHGHNFTWIGWEELTNWSSSDCYLSMFSCNRSTRKGIPIKIRATCNPFGRGHNWIKRRWRLPVPPGMVFGDPIIGSRNAKGDIEPPRIALNSNIAENFLLLDADPGYIDRIKTSAANPAQAKAWVEGSWDIVAGGMFDDVWEPRTHITRGFPHTSLIPHGWKLTRSYDHGQSKPFSVGFWAESNGEPLHGRNGESFGHVKGDLYRIGEWYGCGDEPNSGLRMRTRDIANGILEREQEMGLLGRFRPGPADASIFDRDSIDNLHSVADEFARHGVRWVPSDKGPGSRKLGWQAIRERLSNATPSADGFREGPGLFILPICKRFQEVFPVLPRDDKDMDDVDTDSEDHMGDEVRYRVRWQLREATTGSWS